MSDIGLYNVLKRIPDTTDDEIEKAVADVASSKDVATKADISDIKIALAKLETEFKYLRWALLPLNVAILIKLFL